MQSQLGGTLKDSIAFFGVTDALLPPEPLSLQVFNNLDVRDVERRGRKPHFLHPIRTLPKVVQSGITRKKAKTGAAYTQPKHSYDDGTAVLPVSIRSGFR